MRRAAAVPEIRTMKGLEIEPRYCDVIVERFQNLTGQKATRA